MNPLQSELLRLYGVVPSASADAGDSVRAMVLELTAPPGWRVLGRVWQGVQEELDLPAPAIAVSGTEGLQLWFSLAVPVAVPSALAFLRGLQSRFLPEVAPNRLRATAGVAVAVPALQPATGNWSAFVAPDLAPVFDETPWLDVAPNEEGQAALLRSLRPMGAGAFAAAVEQLAPPPAPSGGMAADGLVQRDPREFLLQVMNDAGVALALRIEAARVLLQAPRDAG